MTTAGRFPLIHKNTLKQIMLILHHEPSLPNEKAAVLSHSGQG